MASESTFAGEPQPWPAVDVLEQYIAPSRIERVDGVLRSRLGSVTAVFEDIFDPHNVAACVRTCEAFGLQDLHWIFSKHSMRTSSSVAKSADQWVNMHRYTSTVQAVRALKDQGFSILVSDLQATDTLETLPLPAKAAIVVGNAHDGISEEMRQLADARYILPMWGFVQSFNLSVALALTLQGVVPRRRAELAAHGRTGDLPMEQMWALRRKWLEFGMTRPDLVRRELGDHEAVP